MKKYLLPFVCFLTSLPTIAQLPEKDSLAKTVFLNEQQLINQSFNSYFNSNIANLYGAGEDDFISKIDSLRNTFIAPLNRLGMTHPGIGKVFFEEQSIDLNYTFDRFILDYGPVHQRITGKKPSRTAAIKARLANTKISDPYLLKYDAFRVYLQSLLEQHLSGELEENPRKYKDSDNQRLDAGLASISKLFKNPAIKNRMTYELLKHHIDNYGVKNIAAHMADFKQANNKDLTLWQRLDSLYQEGIEWRKGHRIESYKKTGNTDLDLHIFKPSSDSTANPVIVFFHGGGWSEGMPDWFFSTCEAYAKKGWLAVAVEYRIRNRHGSLPPAAIEDGKSAIRYLRANADRLKIDTNRIVASGNSAGANLALATGVIDTLDNIVEDLRVSSRPDAIMLNSVSTDFTSGDFWQQYFSDTLFLERISPLHQVRKNLPPILIIQGNRDNNVPLQPVIDFALRMKEAGNDCELHILEGAGHFIWYDRRFSKEVADYRGKFLNRLGLE